MKKTNLDLERKINNAFDKFINWLINENYKILFIPQLFGKDNDSSYMKKFMKKIVKSFLRMRTVIFNSL